MNPVIVFYLEICPPIIWVSEVHMNVYKFGRIDERAEIWRNNRLPILSKGECSPGNVLLLAISRNSGLTLLCVKFV